jgi:serpin B
MSKEHLIKENNKFSMELYEKLKRTESNLFFSPFSIFTALAMIYAGARGLTESQMKETLHITLDQTRFHSEYKKLLGMFQREGDSEIHLANLIAIQEDYKLLEKYLWIIDDNYNGTTMQLNFKESADSCAKINTWVAKQTRDKIKDIIESVDEKMGLVIANAIYFKGTWEKLFKEKDTKNEPFTLSSGEEIEVSMMYQKKKFRFIEEESFQVLEMLYKGTRIFGTLERISMVIFLPRKADGLAELEDSLTIDDIINYISKLQNDWEKEIKIYIPKFKFESKYRLSGVLSSLGMTNAFTDQADFSGISEDPPEKISQIVHKAFVDVNERGTEAAAATAVAVLGASLMKPKIPEFRADHPFLFFLIDTQTKTILFIGRVINPLFKF